MTTLKHWTVDIDIDEHAEDGVTHAKAHLYGDPDRQMRADGRAQRNPGDPIAPDAGDELAVARALSLLAAKLEAMALQTMRKPPGPGPCM